MSETEQIYRDYDEDLFQLEDFIYQDIMPSQQWIAADKRRHYDIGWELDNVDSWKVKYGDAHNATDISK